MITNIKKNCMGTVSFDGKFLGMRKAQDFIVYPIKEMEGSKITIQSDTRIGHLCMDTGAITLAGPHASGAYFHHLPFAERKGQASSEELLLLKAAIMATASGKAGTNGIVYTDNSGAINIFDL